MLLKDEANCVFFKTEVKLHTENRLLFFLLIVVIKRALILGQSKMILTVL